MLFAEGAPQVRILRATTHRITSYNVCYTKLLRGTLLAVCREANMVDDDGKIPGLPRMLTADALATVGGALLGTSTTTTYIESAAGVSDGGRTGLTAAVTAILFLLAIFFTPLVGAVPAFATAPALIIVGIFMLRGIGQIDFYNFEEALPAFLTLILMPLTFSIATGLAFGFASYVLRITSYNVCYTKLLRR